MKKNIFVLLIAILVLSSCGDEPEKTVLGEWNMVKFYNETNTVQESITTKDVIEGTEFDFQTTFNEDNTYTSDGSYTTKVTASTNGVEVFAEEVIITVDEETDAYEVIDNNTIQIKSDGEITLYEIISLTDNNLRLEHRDTFTVSVGDLNISTITFTDLEYTR